MSERLVRAEEYSLHPAAMFVMIEDESKDLLPKVGEYLGDEFGPYASFISTSSELLLVAGLGSWGDGVESS